MDNIIVRARFLGPTNNRGSRISIISDQTREIVPVNYGWRTDNVCKEAVAEACGVSTDNVRHSMDHNGWNFYIVDVQP